jgi:hypothetical protein
MIAKRSVVSVGTHLLAALVGAAITAIAFSYYWKDALRGFMSMSDLVVSAFYGSTVDARRDAGGDSEYDKALRDYLTVLDSLLAREPKSENYSILQFDKTIALGRLALLTEKRGGEADSRRLFAEAAVHCRTYRAGDCSEDSIRKWVVFLETRATMSPGK